MRSLVEKGTTNVKVTFRAFRIPTLLVAGCAIAILSGCASSSTASTTNAQAGSGGPPSQIVTAPGYHLTVFAKGTDSYFAPDALVDDGSHIFIDYQNKTAKDCSDAATANSTVVEYDLQGKVVKSFNVPGHSDGMREDPGSHLLWVTSCEDGNARFVTIDPSAGTITPYTFPPAPHGGGYDDLAFVNGVAFVAASNPNVNSAGVNTFPAIDEMTLSGGTVTLKPVLMGNASATDVVAKSTVTLNEVDPDSMTVDPQGNLVLVNQAGSEIVTVSNPGTPQQAVTRLPVGDQLDDTVWAAQTHGRLLVADSAANTTYWMSGAFAPNTSNRSIFTEAPSDSGVASFIGTIDPTTGLISPIAIGFSSPTGLLFVPGANS